MSEHEIERGIPIPPKDTHPKRKRKFAVLERLEVGESFVHEGTEMDRVSLISACRREWVKTGKRFTTRQVAPGKWRCWRIASDTPDLKPQEHADTAPDDGFRPRRSWSFSTMAVGESFELRGDERDYNRLRGAAGAHTNRTGEKFRVRKIGKGRWRCTRIR